MDILKKSPLFWTIFLDRPIFWTINHPKPYNFHFNSVDLKKITQVMLSLFLIFK